MVSSPPPERADSRLATALEALRLSSAHLADQARADALEIGFLVARRILEMEISASPAPLFSLVRSAIRRVGDARRVTVRVCPDDAARLRASEEAAEHAGLSLARIDVEPDASLGPGDCVVETELGGVDGRLATRLAELKQAVEMAAEGDAA